MDWEDLRNLGTATSIAKVAISLADRLNGPKPTLHLKVKSTGGNARGLTFTAEVSQVANRVPALDVHVFAEIADPEKDVVEQIFESPSFDLAAGELNRPILFEVPRPGYGDLVPAYNNEPTLYGRELWVTAVSDAGGVDSLVWKEIEYDFEIDRERFDAMVRYRRIALNEATEQDLRDEHKSGMLRRRSSVTSRSATGGRNCEPAQAASA